MLYDLPICRATGAMAPLMQLGIAWSFMSWGGGKQQEALLKIGTHAGWDSSASVPHAAEHLGSGSLHAKRPV